MKNNSIDGTGTETMTTRTSKRQYPSNESSESGNRDDKPIPFLRRLIDMLQENESIISFHPGDRKKNCPHTPGRIIVHDRAKVESEILPRYFNHASFASLRRQLNYFAFSRVGKGKQRGATYCNEQVVELFDILRLKRRVVGSTIPTVQSKAFDPPKDTATTASSSSFDSTNGLPQVSKTTPMSPSTTTHIVSLESSSRILNKTNSNKIVKKKVSKRRTSKPSKKAKQIIESVVPVVHLPTKKARLDNYSYSNSNPTNKPKLPLRTQNENDMATKELSEQSYTAVSPPPCELAQHTSAPKITLDLTQPVTQSQPPPNLNFSVNMNQHSSVWLMNAAQSAINRMQQSTTNCTLENDRDAEQVVSQHSAKEADVLAGCNALLALGCQPSASA